ncbi:disease resistance protein RPS5-like [Neltuma alba]|uniref:disease resistance protein RPS5-like n=1 Tax=Neltuma alba TaxID=207710 RepID=UPI0010A2DD90|nr:disease resistance protein RPS5-like [Prosopis alba]
MEVVASVSSIIGLCCSLHEVFRNSCKHLITPRRRIRQLRNLMRQLDARKKDAIREVVSLITENGLHRPTIGCCCICSRIKRGELIEEKIIDINELLETVPREEYSIPIPINKRGDVLSATPMIEYETHKQIFMKIWGFLLDENARRIGVWGMGGASKTTIMSEINNCLVKGSSQFNCTIWVEASKDLKKMRQDIAVKLGLTFQETDDERARASKLLEAFKRRKAFALILDDVWEPFSIEEVGIPVPTVEKGCKLVIITRNLMVCRVMEIDKDVEVKVLEDDEAWNLFKDKVGEERVLSDPDLQSIAMEVAKKCGGLPLPIIAIGCALRNTTSIREWQNALEELRTSSDGIYNIDEAVCSHLKLSYSKLKDDTRQSCFLFCALYPKGHLIDENELINYWVWEDLLGDVNMSATKQKGQMIIDELISACLSELKIENGVRCVKLHDLIKRYAVTIMSKNSRCIVNAGMGQVRPPLPHEWKEDVQWVSLMRNDVKSIDFSPMCPGITSLLLQYNSFEKNILDHFFDSMEGLKVLDLSCSAYVSFEFEESMCLDIKPLLESYSSSIFSKAHYIEILRFFIFWTFNRTSTRDGTIDQFETPGFLHIRSKLRSWGRIEI